MAEISVHLFGPLDAVVGPYVEYVVLAFALATFVTRKVAHDAHREAAETGDDEALSRHPLHVTALVGLVLASFYLLTIHYHAGIVLSTLVVGLFITELFEVEARKVEVREDHGLEPPKAAITMGVVVLLYAAYLSLFDYVAPIWNSIV